MLDFTYYETVAEGDKHFVVKMVKTFLEDVPVMVEAINANVREQNLPALGKAIHKLKPSWTMPGLDVSLLDNIQLEIKGNADYAVIALEVEKINTTAQAAYKGMQRKLETLTVEN